MITTDQWLFLVNRFIDPSAYTDHWDLDNYNPDGYVYSLKHKKTIYRDDIKAIAYLKQKNLFVVYETLLNHEVFVDKCFNELFVEALYEKYKHEHIAILNSVYNEKLLRNITESSRRHLEKSIDIIKMHMSFDGDIDSLYYSKKPKAQEIPENEPLIKSLFL